MINPDILTGRMGNRMFQIAYLYSQVKDGVIPDWYVQDPKHFDKYQGEIRDLFGQDIGRLPYVGIHVRRGDYVNNPYYVDLAADSPDGRFPEYYAKAIAHFPTEQFLVFSDDPEFCKQLFWDIYDGDRFTIVEGQTELEDFNQLASCEHQIIANSSFSWWAAYLSYPHENKKIIAPSVGRWYSDGIERTMCPNSWIRI